MHDEERYPDPETFKPTRFLTSDGKLNRDVPDPDDVFGYSRRVCPGRHFALDMLWLSIASILAVFNVEKSVDESGNVVEPSGEHTSGLVRYVYSQLIYGRMLIQNSTQHACAVRSNLQTAITGRVEPCSVVLADGIRLGVCKCLAAMALHVSTQCSTLGGSTEFGA